MKHAAADQAVGVFTCFIHLAVFVHVCLIRPVARPLDIHSTHHLGPAHIPARSLLVPMTMQRSSRFGTTLLLLGCALIITGPAQPNHHVGVDAQPITFSGAGCAQITPGPPANVQGKALSADSIQVQCVSIDNDRWVELCLLIGMHSGTTLSWTQQTTRICNL